MLSTYRILIEFLCIFFGYPMRYYHLMHSFTGTGYCPSDGQSDPTYHDTILCTCIICLVSHIIHHNLMCVLVLVSVDVVSFLSIEFLCVWLVVGMEWPLWDRIHSQVLEVVRENLEYLPTLNIEAQHWGQLSVFLNSCVSGSWSWDGMT